jgi:hypothetical protein
MKTVWLVPALILLSLLGPAYAQMAQTSYTVSLNAFSLQISFPSQIMPGDNVTVDVQGTPKANSAYLQSLTVTIYYADATGLHQLSTQTLISNSASNDGYYAYGGYATPSASFTKSFSVTVPQDAPRTSLIALFSENVQSNYYDYSSYYYPSTYSTGMKHYRTFFYVYYPSYYYSSSTDQGIAPLSYINATTPEYVALQSEYQILQQQVSQAQIQNQQLQNTISQQSTTMNQLNQQLALAGNMTQRYQALALVFGILAAALAALAVYQSRSKKPETAKSK